MKLLLISDMESPYFWDYYKPGRLDSIDLILSCGDLKPEYLSFLVTMGRARVLYVPGNHDAIYETRPPEVCGSWVWGAPCSTAAAPISTPSGRCAAGSSS